LTFTNIYFYHSDFFYGDNESELEDENEEQVLRIGEEFGSWDEADKFFDEYALSNGFAIRKCRGDYIASEDGSQRLVRRTYSCTFSGNYKPNKVTDISKQRQRTSNSIGCPWKANLNWPKTSPSIHLTSFNNDHNHSLNPLIHKISPKYRRFSEEIKADIKFYMTHGGPSIGAKIIRNLLQAKYPQQYIHPKTLYNTIQECKPLTPTVLQHDATNLLNLLREHQAKNPEWYYQARFDEIDGRLTSIFWMSPMQKQLWLRYHDVVVNDSTYKKNRYDLTLNIIVCIDCDNHSRLVACALVDDETEATFKWIYENVKIATGNIAPHSIYTDGDPAMFRAIKEVFNTTVHFICIYHIDQNIQKKLKSILGMNFTQFHKDFYQARNSLNVEKFNFFWEKLKSNYPLAVPYLNRVLDQNQTAWALCYNRRMFTAGIQSTSRVEAMNSIIASDTNRSTGLCQLFNILMGRCDLEAETVLINQQLQKQPNVSLPTVYNTIYKSIDEEIQSFLLPNMHNKVRAQISESFLYTAQQFEGNLEEYVNVSNFFCLLL
jgi:hypothetical protein